MKTRMIRPLFFFLLFSFLSCHSISLAQADKLFPLHRDGAGGYVDSTGTFVIKPQYRSVFDFHDGYAVVVLPGGERRGYIDTSNRLFIIDDAYLLNDYTASDPIGFDKKGNGGWGFLSPKDFSVVIPPIFDDIDPFSEGYALVLDRKSDADDMKYFINEKGENAFGTKYNWAYSFSEGLAAVSDGSKYGFIDTTGQLVIGYTYDKVGYTHDKLGVFHEGLAAVGEKINGIVKWGFINPKGELVIPYRFEGVYSFSEGVCAASISKKWGIIDKRGNWVLTPVYSKLKSPSESLIPYLEDTRWGFMEVKGTPLTEPIFDDVLPFEDGVANVDKYITTPTAIVLQQGLLFKDGRLIWGDIPFVTRGDI